MTGGRSDMNRNHILFSVRAYQRQDAATILSWCQDPIGFYQWSAGMLGTYPASVEAFRFVETMTAFTAVKDDRPVGFFTLRTPDEQPTERRFGFVIVDPVYRSQGYGRQMLQWGINKVFEQDGAERVSLSVFEQNTAAYRCYIGAGFEEVPQEMPEVYDIMGEPWRCLTMQLAKTHWQSTDFR